METQEGKKTVVTEELVKEWTSHPIQETIMTAFQYMPNKML